MGKARKFDAVIIGAGLGGLTAAALLAKSGKNVCVLERNRSLGGAASVYRVDGLTIEASLHETADPRDPRDLKHAILTRLGLLDQLDWVPVSPLHTVIGGPVGEALALPHGFQEAGNALAKRFPGHEGGIRRVLSRMSHIYDTLGALTEASESRSLRGLAANLPGLLPVIRDWRLSLDQAFERDLADCEGAKCALAANLPYYADDPRGLWWLFFAVAQGGYLGSGGVYIRQGSASLSRALALMVKRSGGDVIMGREAVGIDLDSDGRPKSVRHVDRDGQNADTIETSTVLASPAPQRLAEALPERQRSAFLKPFADLNPSISLFSAHFGLRENPAKFGLPGYSTVLLPDWMDRLADYSEAGALLADRPSNRMPPLTIVNYGAIDAGLNEPGKTLVTVVGVDSVENWRGLTKGEEADRRAAWLDAISEALETRFPGFSAATAERVFLNARSVRDYLGTPDGAVYGFAPEPPRRSFLAGIGRSPKTPIPNLFLASSFASSGGFSGAMAAGASAARAAEQALQKR